MRVGIVVVPESARLVNNYVSSLINVKLIPHNNRSLNVWWQKFPMA